MQGVAKGSIIVHANFHEIISSDLRKILLFNFIHSFVLFLVQSRSRIRPARNMVWLQEFRSSESFVVATVSTAIFTVSDRRQWGVPVSH